MNRPIHTRLQRWKKGMKYALIGILISMSFCFLINMLPGSHPAPNLPRPSGSDMTDGLTALAAIALSFATGVAGFLIGFNLD